MLENAQAKQTPLMRRNGGLCRSKYDNNGMISQLFCSNEILVSFRSDCHTLSKVKLVNIKPDNSGSLPVARLQDGAKNETNQMNDSELA